MMPGSERWGGEGNCGGVFHVEHVGDAGELIRITCIRITCASRRRSVFAPVWCTRRYPLRLATVNAARWSVASIRSIAIRRT